VAIKVLCIAGLGHSGSTLLGALLGQLDGFFYAGELRSIARALERGELCGCELPLPECPVWSVVLEGLKPAQLKLDERDESALGLVRQRLRRRAPDGGFAALPARIAATTGSRVVVDSSKWPGYASLLEQIDGVGLAVVHLIRDPRGVVHSRQKRGLRAGRPPELSPVRSALQWNVWNPVIEAAWRDGRYARLRYEDFVAKPEEAVHRLARLAGEEAGQTLFTAPDTVELDTTHSVAGNRNRFQKGSVRIALDEEWRTPQGLSPVDRRLVGALTWPLRLRYGYR
jgi:hypothetical protein